MSNRKQVVNQVIQRWLKLPDGLTPQVDCDKCTMSELHPMEQKRWHLYKCCTFQPFVANFYCGAMLEAGVSPFTAGAMQAVIQPLGVMATRRFRDLSDATPDSERGEAHLCSYFDRKKRSCRIWSFRPGECSLYFCSTDPKSRERGEWSARAFHLESSMAQMALAHLGFSPRQLSDQVNQLNDPREDLQSLAATDAEELYRAAWKWVQTQSEYDVSSWLSFDNAKSGE